MTGAAAQFDQPAMRPDPLGDLVGIFLKDRGFGAGQVILRRAANLLEQLGAARIVEELAGQRFGLPRQTGEHRVAKALLARRQIMKGEGGSIIHWGSLSRYP